MELDFKKKKRVSLGRGKGLVPISDGDQKKELIMLRVSAQEKNVIDSFCKFSNLKRSDIIRKYVSEGLSKDLQMYPTLF